jgi:hypothetical protein
VAIFPLGVRRLVTVRRFRCITCKRTFTRLPDFLLPFKRYVATEIEAVLRHIYDGGVLSRSSCEADERTQWRWKGEFHRKLKEWAGILESWVFTLHHRLPNLFRYISHPLKRLEEDLSHLPPLPSHWAVLVKAYFAEIRTRLCGGV